MAIIENIIKFFKTLFQPSEESKEFEEHSEKCIKCGGSTVKKEFLSTREEIITYTCETCRFTYTMFNHGPPRRVTCEGLGYGTFYRSYYPEDSE